MEGIQAGEDHKHWLNKYRNQSMEFRYWINTKYGFGLDLKNCICIIFNDIIDYNYHLINIWLIIVYIIAIFVVFHQAGCLETWRAVLVFFLRTTSSRLLPRTTTACTFFEGTREGEACEALHPETCRQIPASLNSEETVQYGQGAQRGGEGTSTLCLSLPWSTSGTKEQWENNLISELFRICHD